MAAPTAPAGCAASPTIGFLFSVLSFTPGTCSRSSLAPAWGRAQACRGSSWEPHSRVRDMHHASVQQQASNVLPIHHPYPPTFGQVQLRRVYHADGVLAQRSPVHCWLLALCHKRPGGQEKAAVSAASPSMWKRFDARHLFYLLSIASPAHVASAAEQAVQQYTSCPYRRHGHQPRRQLLVGVLWVGRQQHAAAPAGGGPGIDAALLWLGSRWVHVQQPAMSTVAEAQAAFQHDRPLLHHADTSGTGAAQLTLVSSTTAAPLGV